MPDGPETTLSPDQAVDRLEVLHAIAVQAQRDALARFAAGGPPPDAIGGSASAIPNSAWSGNRVGRCRSPAAPGQVPITRHLCHDDYRASSDLHQGLWY
jgi:hypothetical protein